MSIVPLSRTLLDRELLRKLPIYAANVAKRLRKKILLTVGAKYAFNYLLLEFDRILSRDIIPQSDAPDRPNEAISGMTNFKVIEHRRKYQVTDPREKDFLRSRGLPETYIYSATSFTCELASVTLQMDDGVVCTRDMRLLEDSANGRQRLIKSSAYGEPKPSAPHLKGTHSSIWGRNDNNHYHWLFYELPRLYSLEQVTTESITLLMPDDLHSPYKQMLDWFLPCNVMVRYVPRQSWWRIERFVFPSYTIDPDRNIPPEAHTRYIRHLILDRLRLPDSPAAGTKRLYISRRKAAFRRMKNEEAVIHMLRSYGYEPYLLEDMSFEDQVRLFHNAESVVAPHGAGLANMLFAGAIPLVELIPQHMPACYFMLAKFMGQYYRYVDTLPDPKVRGHREAQLRDFVVSVTEVEQVVREVLRTGR